MHADLKLPFILINIISIDDGSRPITPVWRYYTGVVILSQTFFICGFRPMPRRNEEESCDEIWKITFPLKKELLRGSS